MCMCVCVCLASSYVRSARQSKLANLLHARELTKRLPAGVGVSAVHPGFVRSGLIKHTMGPVTQTVASPFMTRGFGMIEPWEGAQASLVAALGSLEGDRNGAYFAQVRSCRRKLRVV